MWTLECEQAFNTLKNALMGSTIMAYPIEGCPFIVDTDASNLAAGAVLSQIQDGQEKVIMYWSKAFSKSQRNYSVTQWELLALVLALEAFGYYLLGLKSFTVRVDHGVLTYLHSSTSKGVLYDRWKTRLELFNFETEYRKGKNHGIVPDLWRRLTPPLRKSVFNPAGG